MKKTGDYDAELEDRQEMNELVDSEPEIYGADIEDIPPPKKSSKRK